MTSIRKYQKNSRIRDLARKEYNRSARPKECAKCAYSLHYEICHIKAIKDLSKDSFITEINHMDNLVALCRNCHWELDNGNLKF